MRPSGAGTWADQPVEVEARYGAPWIHLDRRMVRLNRRVVRLDRRVVRLSAAWYASIATWCASIALFASCRSFCRRIPRLQVRIDMYDPIRLGQQTRYAYTTPFTLRTSFLSRTPRLHSRSALPGWPRPPHDTPRSRRPRPSVDARWLSQVCLDRRAKRLPHDTALDPPARQPADRRGCRAAPGSASITTW